MTNTGSQDGEVLEPATIEQLRGVLTPEMRGELVELFRVQVHSSVRELAASLRRGDEAECRRLAHALKGSSATMGASRLQGLCGRLASAEPSGAEAQLRELEQVSADSLRAVTEALA